jgi:hypothetical protein
MTTSSNPVNTLQEVNQLIAVPVETAMSYTGENCPMLTSLVAQTPESAMKGSHTREHPVITGYNHGITAQGGNEGQDIQNKLVSGNSIAVGSARITGNRYSLLAELASPTIERLSKAGAIDSYMMTWLGAQFRSQTKMLEEQVTFGDKGMAKVASDASVVNSSAFIGLAIPARNAGNKFEFDIPAFPSTHLGWVQGPNNTVFVQLQPRSVATGTFVQLQGLNLDFVDLASASILASLEITDYEPSAYVLKCRGSLVSSQSLVGATIFRKGFYGRSMVGLEGIVYHDKKLFGLDTQENTFWRTNRGSFKVGSANGTLSVAEIAKLAEKHSPYIAEESVVDVHPLVMAGFMVDYTTAKEASSVSNKPGRYDIREEVGTVHTGLKGISLTIGNKKLSLLANHSMKMGQAWIRPIENGKSMTSPIHLVGSHVMNADNPYRMLESKQLAADGKPEQIKVFDWLKAGDSQNQSYSGVLTSDLAVFPTGGLRKLVALADFDVSAIEYDALIA